MSRLEKNGANKYVYIYIYILYGKNLEERNKSRRQLYITSGEISSWGQKNLEKAGRTNNLRGCRLQRTIGHLVVEFVPAISKKSLICPKCVPGKNYSLGWIGRKSLNLLRVWSQQVYPRTQGVRLWWQVPLNLAGIRTPAIYIYIYTYICLVSGKQRNPPKKQKKQKGELVLVKFSRACLAIGWARNVFGNLRGLWEVIPRSQVLLPQLAKHPPKGSISLLRIWFLRAEAWIANLEPWSSHFRTSGLAKNLQTFCLP